VCMYVRATGTSFTTVRVRHGSTHLKYLGDPP